MKRQQNKKKKGNERKKGGRWAPPAAPRRKQLPGWQHRRRGEARKMEHPPHTHAPQEWREPGARSSPELRLPSELAQPTARPCA